MWHRVSRCFLRGFLNVSECCESWILFVTLRELETWRRDRRREADDERTRTTTKTHNAPENDPDPHPVAGMWHGIPPRLPSKF